MEANREREKKILKGTAYSLPSPVHSADGIDDDISEVAYSTFLFQFKSNNDPIPSLIDQQQHGKFTVMR